MDVHPRAKTDKPSGRFKETRVPMRLYMGIVFLVIGFSLYLVAK